LEAPLEALLKVPLEAQLKAPLEVEALSQKYPQLKSDPDYLKVQGAVTQFPVSAATAKPKCPPAGASPEAEARGGRGT
jgi:hypothetical protein